MKNKSETKDLIVGVLSWVALLTILALLMQGCQSPAELHHRKMEKAKTRIGKILVKFPEIKSSFDTTYVKLDTLTTLREIVRTDTVFIQGSAIVDTVIQFTLLDTLFKFSKDNVNVEISQEIGGGPVRAVVNVVPHYIIKVDTFNYRDTVFINTFNTHSVTILDTKHSFWWSLWFQVKGWLWFILVILAILVILRIVFKFLK